MDDIFAADGILARAMPGYRPRAGQVEMARAVEKAAASGGCFMFEAGTGIGKTFAYLAPIIQNGLSAVISTGTRALQDQLFLGDIPLLEKAFGRKVRATVLKGRANYLCKRNIAAGGGGMLSGAEDSEWAKITAFAAHTKDGDIRSADNIAADSPAIAAAVSTRESCPVQKCDYYGECFLYAARARAREADIVIVNHHLFLADMRLKEEGIAEILPSRDVLLFDEAHLLPQLATQYLGDGASVLQLLRLIKQSKSNTPAALALTAAAERYLRELSALGGLRLPRDVVMTNAKTADAGAVVAQAAQGFAEELIDNAGEDEVAANCGEATLRWARQMGEWLAEEDESENGEKGEDEEKEGEEESPRVRWLEKNVKNAVMHCAPLSGRAAFLRQWENCNCVIFTSATLSVGGGFDDFAHAAGLDSSNDASAWQSPYDFANRAMLYLPPGLPMPNDAGHTQAAAEVALPLIEANRGRAFVLFSSWRALQTGAEILRERLPPEYVILRQGDESNERLLAKFKNSENAVLAGTLSFWQGVDVKGESLSLVVVDKIPFAPPDDPVLAARDRWRRLRGEDPFRKNQLPAAVTLMKQVAGRLLRDFDDYGVFTACDPRLTTRGYGKVILRSLPPMTQAKTAKEAADFLRRMAAGGK
ncbi:MAG: ATP-dependent DNA helicase [Gammaproteobacteria bacterium]